MTTEVTTFCAMGKNRRPLSSLPDPRGLISALVGPTPCLLSILSSPSSVSSSSPQQAQAAGLLPSSGLGWTSSSSSSSRKVFYLANTVVWSSGYSIGLLICMRLLSSSSCCSSINSAPCVALYTCACVKFFGHGCMHAQHTLPAHASKASSICCCTYRP